MTHLPDELYSRIESSLPLACVDFVPLRRTAAVVEVGLILRESPFGRVWCHLGGRILRGETIRDAIARHADQTLAVGVLLGEDPQPAHVYQWFPPEIAPNGSLITGVDPRKHAIGLSFVVDFVGVPQPRNEAFDFRYFAVDELPDPLWPGCQALIACLARSWTGSRP